MKFLTMLVLVGCAHTTTEPLSKQQVVYNSAFKALDQSLADNIELYAKTIPGARYMRLIDLEITNDGEAGVGVIEAQGEQREFVGRLFVYLFCNPQGNCRPVINITKVEVKGGTEPNPTNERL